MTSGTVTDDDDVNYDDDDDDDDHTDDSVNDVAYICANMLLCVRTYPKQWQTTCGCCI